MYVCIMYLVTYRNDDNFKLAKPTFQVRVICKYHSNLAISTDMHVVTYSMLRNNNYGIQL